MCLGKRGLAGGGIYFAESAWDTDHKAHKKGAILECRVRLGRVKMLPFVGDSSITYESLRRERCDSVCVQRHNGLEYVVYNPEQVRPLRNLGEITLEQEEEDIVAEITLEQEHEDVGSLSPRGSGTCGFLSARSCVSVEDSAQVTPLQNLAEITQKQQDVVQPVASVLGRMHASEAPAKTAVLQV
eukprot:933977-Amphidinium_carterae.1